MPERALGSTGVTLPLLGLGGAGQTPLSHPNQEAEAIALIERAWELGVRYFDTAASYGPSETYLGKALPAARDELFLASKTGARDRDTAWQHLERSLERLGTDYLDLWFAHSVSFEDEIDALEAPDGALRAFTEAKEQGLVRAIGVSGHHAPSAIVTALERCPFEVALIPVNAADIHHPRPFATTVLPFARERGIGVIAMKVPAYGRLFSSGALDGMEQAFGFALSQPGVSCATIAAADAEQLAANVQVAANFQQLDEEALATIAQRTAGLWRESTFYRAWT